MTEIAVLIAGAYVIGSIPFSFLVARLVSGQDIRNLGSGNVGATNVARTVGKGPGIVALLLDGAKGWGVVALAEWLLRSDASDPATGWWIGVAAVVGVLGHMFPVWLRFRGGKGVATAAGAFLALDARAFLFVLVVFLIVWIATRWVSLASMLAAAAMPLVLRFVERQSTSVIVASIVIATAVILKHHTNIARLAHGTEPKFPSPK